ncbi:cathepsin C [Caerostris extrusa]|uniref:Cathepsin C n=1 Tax=Caerostris extrusa TaxID=172846 RepID=A0AAV4RR28_CAEEX|nr:cathepsin C [Caerostris extrusa]
MKLLIVCSFIFVLSCVKCDTPANCTYEDIRGEWVFLEGKRESNSSIDCNNFSGPIAHTLKITLRFPNVAFDEFGNKGYWTIATPASAIKFYLVGATMSWARTGPAILDTGYNLLLRFQFPRFLYTPTDQRCILRAWWSR